MVELITTVLRILFSWIDKVIIVVMNFLYDILMKIASLNIVDSEVVKSFSTRVGVILGLFMLFNIATHLLTYIVSPDKVSDKSKGPAKIITNLIVSLLLLATYNTIFSTAYKVQFKILEKQIIPHIVFGVAPEEDEEDIEISYYVFSSMLTINPDVDVNGVCSGVFYKGVTDECDTFLTEKMDSSRSVFEYGVKNGDASALLDSDVITASAEGGYVFNYMFIFSTVIGVLVTFLLFNFSLDVAKRSVKLYFLQVIAPLPIIANMVPGKGEDTFKKWYKSCITTYLDVFIRLIGLFFAVFLISIMYQSLTDTFAQHPIIGVFIILGALMFAKELPQLIQDLTGLKLDGGFTLNPIKKLNSVPVLGKGFGAAGGAIAGARAGGRVGNALGGALTGALMGASNIPLTGTKDGKWALTSATNDVYKRMTGNDFINFSLAKMPLRYGAKEKVQEIKDARSVATDRLNAYNSELNISEGMTSNLANELIKKGIDINDIASARAQLEINKQRGNSVSRADYDNASSLVERLNKEKERLNTMLQNANASGNTTNAQRITQKMNEITNRINSAAAIKTQYEANEEMLRGIDNTLDMIDKYNSGIEEQNGLRKRISLVQKDIDDLNNEKRQRERFYDYDPSPQDDIRKLVNDTSSREDYDKRIDGKM